MPEVIKTWIAGSPFAFKTTITADATGTNDIGLKIEPRIGTSMRLNSLMIGPDDYAADRTITVYKMDAAGNVLSILSKTTTLDNEYFKGLIKAGVDNLAALLDAHIGYSHSDELMLHYNDYILVEATQLSQAETLTINLRAQIYGYEKPITSTTGTGPIKVDAYNKMLG